MNSAYIIHLKTKTICIFGVWKEGESYDHLKNSMNRGLIDISVFSIEPT